MASDLLNVEYEMPQQDAALGANVCAIKYAWAKVPTEPGPE